MSLSLQVIYESYSHAWLNFTVSILLLPRQTNIKFMEKNILSPLSFYPLPEPFVAYIVETYLTLLI